jgi:hypothetical protein
MTNFGHSYARYTNPSRYRMVKIWLRRARGSELISKVFALRPLGSHHFRVALAPKELTSQKKTEMLLMFNGFK